MAVAAAATAIAATTAAGTTGTAFAAPAGARSANTTASVPGDLTGDGVPDVAVITGGGYAKAPGSLSFFSNGSAPVTASDDAHSPEGDNWSNYVVTHHGSLTGGTLDDLLVLNTVSHQLYAYPNDAGTGGTPGHFTSRFSTRLAKPACAPPTDCADYDATWNSTTQIVATVGSANTAGLPDVITVENGKLWYYPGKAGTILGSPSLLGTGNWGNTTVLAPGKAVSAPALWVRENTSGAIATLPLTFKADGTPAARLAPPTTVQLENGSTRSDGAHLCLGTGPSGPGVRGFDCDNIPYGVDSQWILGADGTLRATGGCLDSTPDAAPAQPIWRSSPCSGASSQKWKAGADGTIREPGSGRCLTLVNNSYVGYLTELDPCDGTPSQLWGTSGAQGPGALPNPQNVLPVSVQQNSAQLADFGNAHTLAVAAGRDGTPDLFTAGGWVQQYPGRPPVNGVAQFGDRVELGRDNPRFTTVGRAGDSMVNYDVVYSQCAKLTLQRDGNLVLTKLKTGQTLWSSGTAGLYAAYAMVEPDGSFGVNRYGDSQVVWSTQTPSPSPSTTLLAVQDDCDMVLRTGGTQLWSTNTAPWSKGSVLAPGITLHGGDSATSAGARLSMQADGNLVLYTTEASGRTLWSTVTWGHPGASATLQPDGNLVVHDTGNNAVWSSGTWGHPGARLTVQDDRNLVLYDSDNKPVWSTGTWAAGPDSRGVPVAVGTVLYPGTSIVAAGTHLDMQADGNLVLYSKATGRALWSTSTWGHPGARAAMQADGNFVLYDANGGGLWSTGTYGHANAHLVVQDDNNTVLYGPQGDPLWSTGTWHQS
ncbi:ricin-type beta-trefoil lectin domain protein [Kitasatospora sp. NPDC059673]|uniref:ricin-type beta-trefoil lectin domain protein n=1 Tax=Kitasatospora sp. NPDC059673 TaxID=3346901 RepID=UPI003694F2E4